MNTERAKGDEPGVSRSSEGTTATPTSAESAITSPPIPENFVGYLKSLGPGIIVALAWLGTGDLIDASVSGSTFGYALIWALLVAVSCRFIIVSTLSRYQLCNSVGDETVLDGYRRIWRGFPLLLGASTVILGFVYNSYLLLAAGTALRYLFLPVVDLGRFGISFWALVTMVLSLYMSTRQKQYRWLEVVAQVTMAALVVSFVIALAGTGIDVVELLKGIAFEVPSGGDGVLTAVTTAIALIGAVGGSAANLLYPYFMRDKGWVGPRYRRVQLYDLATGVGVLFVLILAVWIVAAEVLFGTGAGISAPEDLARMMKLAIGPAGPYVLWVALFFVVFDNIPAQADVFSRLFVEGLHKSYPKRAELARKRLGTPMLTATDTYRGDPLFRVLQLGLLTVVPVIFSTPWAPNVIILTVLGSSFSVLTIPALIVGLLIMTSSSVLMPQEYRNRWWQVVLLVAIGLIGLYSTYQLIVSLVKLT